MARLRYLTSVVAVALAAALAVPLGAAPDAQPSPADIVHVLNRIGFGPTAADVEIVKRLGIRGYIDQQLHPERIANGDLDRRLAAFSTLTMSSEDISRQFEQPALMARRERQRNAAAAPPDQTRPQRPTDPSRANGNLPMMELSQQKILRAVYSERQLEEVLTDFWFNHFNVDSRKGPVRYMLTEYERDAIRPHVLGKFRDLLEATAKSPAMLFYLDNWMSADPNAAGNAAQSARNRLRLGRPGAAGRPRPDMPPAPQNNNRRNGLNENYGRELLELHTLGVDGGYTQRDVTEVARAFTGWTIEQPRGGGGYRFAARLHDDGEKVVLGQRLRAGGGEKDGEQVLDILADHPSTAVFISRKLAARFVADAPPAALVDRLAATFRETHGDLRVVMTKLLTSPEFMAAEAHGAKVKTPLEFVVSALRTSGVGDLDARPAVRALQTLGMPLYQCQPPTGYKDSADTWVNTGALVARMNVALSLAGGPLRSAIPSAADAGALLHMPVSEATRATIAKASSPAQAAALALGSPEFQRK